MANTMATHADMILLDSVHETYTCAGGSRWETKLSDLLEDMLEYMLDDARDAGAVMARLHRGQYRKPSEIIRQMAGEL